MHDKYQVTYTAVLNDGTEFPGVFRADIAPYIRHNKMDWEGYYKAVQENAIAWAKKERSVVGIYEGEPTKNPNLIFKK